MGLKCGIVLPGGSATEQVDLAVLAEECGWDGVFVWEAAYGIDAWTLLAAIASRTTRVRLGTMLTPLPWRRPWKVASQVATLDQVSAGRAVVGVGLGALDTDLPRTGEVTDLRGRAELLDEGIDLMRLLWSGGSSYHGRHFQYDCDRDDLVRVGRPVQARIPIWVVAAWPRPRSMERVLRCDGVVPQFETEDTDAVPDRVRELRAWLNERGVRSDVDVIIDGETPSDDTEVAAARVAPLADAGCTWWLETRWEMPHHSRERMEQVRKRLRAGPPNGSMRGD
ncbi:MAG: LLM class flavin-dependent oxidoreductase [Acidimicrobiales bacterium]|jgi:alkanesulfonate monooxygenase SsuD/methylene tetrahydromethanopterin reductase-like flavin-dependent oxidoreductase (luciferase family)